MGAVAGCEVEFDQQRLVFVAGLHRSGTTALTRLLAAHPDVSGFTGTPAREDEGQHLQSVYPEARRYGGAGRFALSPDAHLTEDSPLAEQSSGARLLAEWAPYWDLSRPVLVEKSPPNLVMTRFLQALFPSAHFLVVVRHPIVVSLSTRKWTRGLSLDALMRHWFHAHELFRADAAHLRRLHIVKYEQLVDRPEQTLAAVARFLALTGPIPSAGLQRDRSTAYERNWQGLLGSPLPWRRLVARRLVARFESAANACGYSLRELSRVEPFPLPPPPSPR